MCPFPKKVRACFFLLLLSFSYSLFAFFSPLFFLTSRVSPFTSRVLFVLTYTSKQRGVVDVLMRSI